jgi:uncharacterized protein (TIGR02453 family)
MQQLFKGFEEEAFGFFLMIRLNNNIAFFDQNRETYERCLKQPLWDLARDLEPTLLQIDPAIETRPAKCVSRLRRSTRYTKNKLPYRDFLWIGWRDRTRDTGQSHAFGFYFDVSFEEMTCGAGAYAATAAQSKDLRERILANPAGFDRIARAVRQAGFTLSGQDYVRRAVPGHLSPDAAAYYRKKSFHLERALPMDERHTGPELVEILRGALEALAPLYHFVNDQPAQPTA